jgi:hypothetical protein
MLHVIKTKGWVPKYYRPSNEKYIRANDVACFFGCQLTRSLRGNPSIEQCWSTRELLDAIGTCMESMKLRAEHPSWTQDLGKLFRWVTSRKVWSDAKGMMMVMPACPLVEAPMDNYALLKNQQRKSPWRMHQSEAVVKQGRCGWEDCPGKLTSKAVYPRSNQTHRRCKECSTRLGKDVYLCNGYSKGAPVNCHRHYHIYHHNKEFALTIVIN